MKTIKTCKEMFNDHNIYEHRHNDLSCAGEGERWCEMSDQQTLGQVFQILAESRDEGSSEAMVIEFRTSEGRKFNLGTLEVHNDVTEDERLVVDLIELQADTSELLADPAPSLIAEIDRLRSENAKLYESLPTIDNRTRNRASELLDVLISLKRSDVRPGTPVVKLVDVRETVEGLLAENAKLREQVPSRRAWVATARKLTLEALDSVRNAGGKAWEAVSDPQAVINEMRGAEPPDGPITEELCRELGFVLKKQFSCEMYYLDVHGVGEEAWTIGVNIERQLVHIDFSFVGGTWTANRLRKLVEAMRGE